MHPRPLAERLIRYDTSTHDGLQSAAGFIKGWLEARDIDVREYDHKGLPVILADVGAEHGPSLIFHGHYDVVPGRPEQFEPHVDGDRLYGRGAYDMKGGLAAMLCAVHDAAAQDRVRVRFMCVPDEESSDLDERSTDVLVAGGYAGDFALTGEPTDLHIGVEAKGVLAMRLLISGRAAHGSTPWLGDNAVLKALDVFRAIESLPFARESSELFDRPSINLARIIGGDALNKVPDVCTMDVDIRYLPGQEPDSLLDQIAAMEGVEVVRTFTRVPAIVSRSNQFVRALRSAVASSIAGEVLSVGRDGASDAVSFLQADIPAVEFGPLGGGHHGPEEWVSIDSLERYRKALGDFVRELPDWDEPARPASDLEAIEGVKR
jgi:succinyl-diaminopimelate desuccinylase